MRPESKKRVPTQADQAPLAGMMAALDGLNIPTAPAAPEPATPPPAAPNWKPGRVVLRRERAGRGGKTVIIVDDFATHLPPSFIENVARTLRAACGCGGTVRGRAVEIQGDQPAKIRAALEAEGFQVAGVK